jgi:hypothetical protein
VLLLRVWGFWIVVLRDIWDEDVEICQIGDLINCGFRLQSLLGRKAAGC